MTTKFYDALQMDPAVLKRKIAACDTRQEKNYYWIAMAVHSVLIVAFAIVFISLLSGVFGSDNTPLAVALFCMMLGIRFVNFEYCIGDSLVTLAVVLAILVLVPSAAMVLPPLFLIPLHFTAFFAMLYMTTQRPEMGNGGLYSFAYVYLTGNPVLGEALVRRALMALVGYLICGAILFAKHRHHHKTTRFHHVMRKFDLSTPVHLWQLRMALGVSLVLTGRAGIRRGTVYVDGICLRVAAVGISLLRQCSCPLPAADCRSRRRLLRVFCPSFGNTGSPSSTDGSVGRAVSGFLHRLPV